MKMRLIRVAALTLLAMFTSGCAGGEDVSFDEEALKAKAEALTVSMTQGDFEAVSAEFSDKLAGQLSLEQLREGWDKTVEPIGAYIGHNSTSVKVDGRSCIVDVVSRYENNGLMTRFTFNRDAKLEGIWLNYSAVEEAPVESDAFTETEFPVGEYALPGLLTLPAGEADEKPPVVLLIAGSGPNDKNETIGAAGNAPFRDIAHGLAQRGIASLRYDKRFHYKPELSNEPGGMSIEAEVLDDAYDAIEQLLADERIDATRVFVLGHSLGGMLAPKIAADNASLAGVVIMAGTLRELPEVSRDQNREGAEAMRGSLSDEERAALDAQMTAIEAEINAALALTSDDGKTYLGVPALYWYSLSQANGKRYIDRLTLPTLILQGDMDFQVYPDVDYQLWQTSLAGYDNVSFKLYEGLNHLFMKSSGLRSLEDYDAENHVSDEVIDDIAAFALQKNS